MLTHAAKIGQLTFKAMDDEAHRLGWPVPGKPPMGVHFITLTVCELEHGPARNSGFTHENSMVDLSSSLCKRLPGGKFRDGFHDAALAHSIPISVEKSLW